MRFKLLYFIVARLTMKKAHEMVFLGHCMKSQKRADYDSYETVVKGRTCGLRLKNSQSVFMISLIVCRVQAMHKMCEKKADQSLIGFNLLIYWCAQQESNHAAVAHEGLPSGGLAPSGISPEPHGSLSPAPPQAAGRMFLLISNGC